MNANENIPLFHNLNYVDLSTVKKEVSKAVLHFVGGKTFFGCNIKPVVPMKYIVQIHLLSILFLRVFNLLAAGMVLG